MVNDQLFSAVSRVKPAKETRRHVGSELSKSRPDRYLTGIGGLGTGDSSCSSGGSVAACGGGTSCRGGYGAAAGYDAVAGGKGEAACAGAGG